MATTPKTRVLLIFLLTLGCIMPALAAGIEARLDRNRVAEGETLVLRLNVPGDINGTPDMSPLMQDFDLLDSSQSMQMSIINGRSSSSRGWQFVLAPKRTGKLEIPPISVGNASSNALSLEVLPAAQAAQLGPAAPVLLEIDVEPEQPLVQQKVIYTVRLLSRVPLRQTRISEPTIGDAIVEPLGRETEYASQRDGQQYRVIERRYAVFPQRSGSLQIDGPVLSAEVPEQQPRGSGRGSMFPGPDPFADLDRLFGRNSPPGGGSLFGRTRPIQMRGRSITLEVLPQPAGTASPWLPAESVTLNDAWSIDPPQFRVGEPVTRTVAITAQGLSAAQLPLLELGAPDGIKVYPDKPQVQARVDGDTLVAQKVVRAALVPARSGRLTLPEIRLAWWDIASGQQKVASLPAREVEVLPAPAGASAPVDDPAGRPLLSPSSRQAPAVSDSPDAADAGPLSDGSFGSSGSAYWLWAALLLAIAWVVTLALWLRARRAAGQRQTAAAGTPSAAVVAQGDSGNALRRVEQACRSNGAREARRALLQWAQVQWPDDPPRRLDTLAQRLGGGSAALLQQIDQELYADAAHTWDGAAMWHQLSPLLVAQGRMQRDQRQRSALPPLYPQGS